MRKFVLFSLLGALLITTLYAGASLNAAERPFAALSAEERKWLDENRDNIILTYDATFPPWSFETPVASTPGSGRTSPPRSKKCLA